MTMIWNQRTAWKLRSALIREIQSERGGEDVLLIGIALLHREARMMSHDSVCTYCRDDTFVF